MKFSSVRFLFLLVFLQCLALFFLAPSFCEDKQPLVYTIQVDDMVTSGTARNIQRGLGVAEKEQADAVVILLNTPGGLVSATLEIIQDMSASNLPVLTYVNPQGAIAASAGTFILLSGHIAAMSPGTTCGAAMPVTMSVPGAEPAASDQKTINFLAGHMKSIAAERGRPGDLAERFVTENLVLNNSEALEKKVVDLNAADLTELLREVHGKTVQTGAGDRELNTLGARVEALPLNANERLTHLVSNPTLAMVLLMIGIYGLIIGFYSPGFFLPEVLGAIGLILGLYGLGLFQGNLVAGLLILLGVGLLVAELFTPAYGILGVGGLTSVILGILFFPTEPLMPPAWFSAFKAVAIGVGIAGALFVAVVVVGLARLRRYKPVHGEAEFSGTVAVVMQKLDPEGLVKVKGEIWQAVSKDGYTIEEGERVRVYERQGITLLVGCPEKNERGKTKQ